MKFMKASILIMLIMGICLLTACGPKEENTISTPDTVDKTTVDTFKDKFGDKLPWVGSAENEPNVQGT